MGCGGVNCSGVVWGKAGSGGAGRSAGAGRADGADWAGARCSAHAKLPMFSQRFTIHIWMLAVHLI